MRPLHSFAPSESNLETTKSASAKRHPGEKQCTGEETIRPQRRSGAWRKEMKKCHTNSPLHLLNPIRKPRKTHLGSVIRAKNKAPAKKQADRSNAARPGGSIEKKVHKALCSDRVSRNCTDSRTAPNSKIQINFVQTFSHFCSFTFKI